MGQLLFGLPGSLTSSVFLSVKEGLQACCNKHVFTSICTKHAVHREHDGVVQFQTWNEAQCQPISLSSLQQQSFQLLQEAANMWLQVQSIKIRPLTTCSGLVRKLEKEFHVSPCVISLVSMWRHPPQNIPTQ